MKLFKMVLNADFLLFILGMFWLDIAGYIQKIISDCNPKIFGFTTAIILYTAIKYFVP